MYIWCGDDDSDFHHEKHIVGDYTKWHPHIHAIVADGLFHRRGVFYVMAKVPVKPLHHQLYQGATGNPEISERVRLRDTGAP